MIFARRIQRRVAGASVFAVVGLVVATMASVSQAGPSALLRATSDRPDDFAGPQIHVMYVVPSDEVDRQLDTDGSINASTSNLQAWLSGQTNGREMQIDTYQGEPDISFLRLPTSDADMAGRGIYLRDAIESEVHAAGFNSASRIYAVYYDGSNTAACGGGAWPPTLPGDVAAIYLRATYGAGLTCYDPALSKVRLQIMDFAMLHEILHTLGFVATCAPNHTRAGHVSDSPSDLMYAGDAPWRPSILDVGRDDYFEASQSGCLDLSSSPYLVAAPPPPPPLPPPPLKRVDCVVPNLKGRRSDAAKRAIESAHCSVGRVTRVTSAPRLNGRVISQSPPPYARRPRGAKVNLKVGKGRQSCLGRRKPSSASAGAQHAAGVQ